MELLLRVEAERMRRTFPAWLRWTASAKGFRTNPNCDRVRNGAGGRCGVGGGEPVVLWMPAVGEAASAADLGTRASRHRWTIRGPPFLPPSAR